MDEDVTVENPIKIITKDEIMEDLRMRAGVCDFAPLKQEIIVRCYRFNATNFKFFTTVSLGKLIFLNFVGKMPKWDEIWKV